MLPNCLKVCVVIICTGGRVDTTRHAKDQELLERGEAMGQRTDLLPFITGRNMLPLAVIRQHVMQTAPFKAF